MTEQMDIGRLGGLGPAVGGGLDRTSSTTKPQVDFKNVLFDSIDKVDKLQHEAETAMNRLATGETDKVTEVLMAAQKADLAFKTLMQIRNRLVAAYQEINQMRF